MVRLRSYLCRMIRWNTFAAFLGANHRLPKPLLRNDGRNGIVKQKRLLDSFALLAYLNKVPGHEMVKEVLFDAQVSGGPLLMNEINVGETYDIL